MAQNLLGPPVGIGVGGVEQVDAAVDADIHKALGLFLLGVADHGHHAQPAEGHGAKAQDRNTEPALPQQPSFHRDPPQPE
jgi:hypothetical protein